MQAPVRSLSLAFLLSRPWSKEPSFRSFSSSSSSNYSNQSRGGLPRFYSEILPSSQGSVVRVKGDEFWHMTRVLRLKVNDRVELFNGKGSLVEGCIQEIDQSGLNFVALENPKLVSPLDTQWHVFAAFGECLAAFSCFLLA
nr:ribosomal RNA small subunit methyltransferase E isoform X1 [Ipomoea batatas]GMD07211.1 ribosomal RNA small subunit methyltransferase E isoform X1 [Ipomoea batatas]GMD08776.1 ribosomal RNA small subunit methyltransferase E isoform X1 [Ipomoea batatas]